MAILDILKFPHPALRIPAAPIHRFDDALRLLAADLLDTLRAAPGIGVTAPHVGIATRLTVIELSSRDGVRTYVNPEILWASPETTRHEEGSVSMPGVSESVERPARVRVGFQDLDGARCVEEVNGLLAVCLQHEIDQLDGRFWIDRLSRLKRERVVKRFEALKRRA